MASRDLLKSRNYEMAFTVGGLFCVIETADKLKLVLE